MTTDSNVHTLPTATLPVSEVFGNTLQGEGPHTGRPVAFVRLGLCNLACDWCDTPFTWDRERYDLAAENPHTPIRDVLAQLAAIDPATVVLSGGEPLIHHKTLPQLLIGDYEWHAETNGTITPPDWWTDHVTHTTVSPKINTSDPLHKRLRPEPLAAWAHHARHGRAVFKFVATHPHDLNLVEAIADTLDLPPDLVWIMPEGTTPDRVLANHRRLADHIIRRGYNTATRLHTLLWGDERGR